MALVPNAGATLHHVILLWPFPHFLIAIAGAQASRSLGRLGPRLAGVALAAMVACNGLVVNQYVADLSTHGTSVIWTDAIYPLFDYLDSSARSKVITVDWGYSATLCLLSDGQMPLTDISYSLLRPSDAEKTWIASLMQDPRSLFVDHVEGGEQFPGVHSRIASIAADAGYARRAFRVITDRNNRLRFEIVQYVPKQ
jgi:hypothetical protein